MTLTFLEGVLIGSISILVIFLAAFYSLYKKSVSKLFNKWKEEELSKELSRSLTAQRSVIKGKISEQLFPVLADRGENLADFRFLGSPIDYIVFDGLSSARDGANVDIKIKFLEIKSTKDANLTRAEKEIRKAVENKRVEWEEINL